ncbi:hypothetical protein Drorol1_Dr00021997 [Drosera rotundifolia]
METLFSDADPFSATTTALPDDTVLFSIFPDSTLSPSSLFSLHLAILDYIAPFTASHIWQHDPFTISISDGGSDGGGGAGVPCLRGSVRFGDNVDDEWFVVWLLFEITCRFKDLTVHVCDSDGEFLLIESAFHLPNWLSKNPNPNFVTNTPRCLIRGGKVHIVGRDLVERGAGVREVLNWLIEREGKETEAGEAVERVIGRRIGEYPERARKGVCRVRVRVPVTVARVLKEEPAMVALAVEGFYDRDVDMMRYAARMERFGVLEMVVVGVRMSRVMYAQLMMQRFQAPKGYPMVTRVGGDGVAFKEAELGMKIACGFEMMYQQRKKKGEEGKGETWKAFEASLERNGYFRGLLPGSEEYNRLMRNADSYYRKSSLHKRTSEILSAPVRRIDEILALPYSVDDFTGTDVPPSDDDSWLYSGEDELNAALMERQQEMDLYEQTKKSKKKGKKKDDEQTSSSGVTNNFDPVDIARSMQAFVKKVSSYQGAEVPENRDLDEVDFDADRLIKEMEAVLGPLEKEDADSDDIEECSSLDMDSDDEMNDVADWEEGHEARKESFLNTYSDVLNKELNTTTLKKSFIRASDLSDNKDEGTSGAMDEDRDEVFTPVDVDVNLVQNILDSFYSQQGLPGPASNLLGLMGVQLPRDTNKDK